MLKVCDSCIYKLQDDNNKWVFICPKCATTWSADNKGACPNCKDKNPSYVNSKEKEEAVKQNTAYEAAASEAEKLDPVLADQIRAMKIDENPTV